MLYNEPVHLYAVKKDERGLHISFGFHDCYRLYDPDNEEKVGVFVDLPFVRTLDQQLQDKIIGKKYSVQEYMNLASKNGLASENNNIVKSNKLLD